MKISVIIPTLDEAERIRRILMHLKNIDHSLELIVVDAHSQDRTSQLAATLAKIVHSARGRGVQMNAGVKAACGEVLWFLHADCFSHPESVRAIRNALKNPAIVGGALEYRLDAKGWFFRLSEFMSNKKNYLLRTFYGDMGIFVRRNVFERMSGYQEISLMQDMDFCSRLKKEVKVVILPYRIRISARRWFEEGKVKNVVRNWILQIGWKLGVSPNSLAKWYKFK